MKKLFLILVSGLILSAAHNLFALKPIEMQIQEKEKFLREEGYEGVAPLDLKAIKELSNNEKKILLRSLEFYLKNDRMPEGPDFRSLGNVAKKTVQTLEQYYYDNSLIILLYKYIYSNSEIKTNLTSPENLEKELKELKQYKQEEFKKLEQAKKEEEKQKESAGKIDELIRELQSSLREGYENYEHPADLDLKAINELPVLEKVKLLKALEFFVKSNLNASSLNSDDNFRALQEPAKAQFEILKQNTNPRLIYLVYKYIYNSLGKEQAEAVIKPEDLESEIEKMLNREKEGYEA